MDKKPIWVSPKIWRALKAIKAQTDISMKDYAEKAIVEQLKKEGHDLESITNFIDSSSVQPEAPGNGAAGD